MRTFIVICLLVAVASAGYYNTFDINNRNNLTERDAKHQKFILDLLRHLQNDVTKKDFAKYAHTIKVDNKNDYKNMNKVFTFVTMFQNGMFVKRGDTFSFLDRRNVITTKVLYDFFDTMTNWNVIAHNLIWSRRHINEYQFWYLLTLLQTHHVEFKNIVLPAMYEVLPNQFFGGDVLNQGMLGLFSNFDNMKNDKIVIMQNFTNGMLGSMIDDDNDNVNDLNDVKDNKITDWYTLKKVVNDIHIQSHKISMINMQNVNDDNKDIKTEIFNNVRNLNQGNKFDNNGEDRLNYFTQDIGLNNYYFFTRFENSKILNNIQMYNNSNSKSVFQKASGLAINGNEVKDKINQRGARYLYQMQQLVARYNLERLSNGLDNVKEVSFDGTVDNGVFTTLQQTNGLQMLNRMNNYQVNNQNTRKMIDLIKDYENRYRQAIDQGFVETLGGDEISITNKYGFNILGNLLQGNTNNVNTQYYRTLETFYRLIFGGNYVDNVDRADKRFTTTVMGHHETCLRDPVFWQIMKRITNFADQYKTKLTGYTKKDTNFDGVKINDVKVDKMVTTFGYFDADITNGFNAEMIKMCKVQNGISSYKKSDSGSYSKSSSSKSYDSSYEDEISKNYVSSKNGKFSGNNSVIKKFNKHGKFYNYKSYSGSNSISESRSNSRSSSWKNYFGLGKNNKSYSENRSVSAIKNLSKLRKMLNNVSGVRNNSDLKKLKVTLNKLKNMSNVRGLKNVRGISKIRDNVSKIRNVNKYKNNSLIRNLSKMRKDLSIIRKINKNVSNRTINKTVIRKLIKNVRYVSKNSVERILKKVNSQSGSGRGSNSSSGFRYNKSSSSSSSSSESGSFSRERSWSKKYVGGGGDSTMRKELNKFGNPGNNQKMNYYKKIMGLNDFMVIGRQRRLDTKKFTVKIDITSKKDTVGIVRIFLGPKINNKQQLNDNRKNFVELDQFIVKLNSGQNVIYRESIDFKNVVGSPESFNVLYTRTINFLKNGGDKENLNTLYNINYDTNNNNYGFPHRLLLPKGTTGGQSYTLFVTINDLDKTNVNDVKYINDNNWNNFIKDNKNSENEDTSDSSSDSDSISKSISRKWNSNLSSDSDSSSESTSNSREKIASKQVINFNKLGDSKNKVWCKSGNVYIYNCNNGNKNIGNGDGILDKRAFGFPLDRNIIDVNGFIVDNMFFKDVTIVHIDSSNNN